MSNKFEHPNTQFPWPLAFVIVGVSLTLLGGCIVERHYTHLADAATQEDRHDS